MEKIKILRVATVPFALLGSRELLRILDSRLDLDLRVACSHGEFFDEIESKVTSPIKVIAISRDISPIQDLVSILKLYKYLREEKFDIVHSNTPKGGLITSIAGFLARVPIRLHTFTGQRWATLNGSKRKLMILADRLISQLNTLVLADSHSQIDILLKEKIVDTNKIMVLDRGALNGIDFERFNFEKLYKLRLELRQQFQIADNEVCISFVGRVVKEKGIEELILAFKQLQEKGHRVHLMLVGPFEDYLDPLATNIKKIIEENPQIHFTGRVDFPEQTIIASDIFCLPSYREGFPMVVLEAASLKLPTIASRVPGCTDTVIENETGLLFEPRSVESLFRNLEKLILDEKLRAKIGENAFDYVKTHFSNEKYAELYVQKYKELMEMRKQKK